MAGGLIRSEEISLAPNSVIYATVLADAFLVASTQGYLNVECRHPRFVLRDCIAGEPMDFRRGAVGSRFDAGVTSVVLTQQARRQRRPRPLVDNASVREGWCCIELATQTDYHPWASLQLVAISRSRQLILGFSSVTYLASTVPEGDLSATFNQIVDGSKSCHCTVHPPSAFFDWLPSRRFQFERILETPDWPESLGGFLAVADFRERPEHTAFRAMVAKLTGPSRLGVDL